MKKTIIIFTIILLLSMGVFGYYKFNYTNKNGNKLVENIVDKNNDEKIEKDKASGILDEKQEENDSPKIDENKEKETTKKVIANNNQNTQSNTKKEETPKQIITNTETQNNEQPKVEKKPWEELGISENDYYNKPMWNWMTIEFNASSYNSQAATENACREYGNKKAEEEGLGFSCTNVLSYSGKYLGEHIKFF